MLPSELLISRQRGGQVQPKRLSIAVETCDQARQLIDLFSEHVGKPRREVDRALADLEGTRPDFKIQRGLAHLLDSAFATFEVVSPIEPSELRQRVFTAAAATVPSPAQSIATLERVARDLSQTLDRELFAEELRAALYADLNENKILTRFEPPSPEALIHRYNLSQVQGVFYRASHLRIDAYRNDPGQYKLLFRYLKLFQLMTYIEGDESCGFTITVDGPASLFRPSTRYGLAIAKVIPALLHVSKWQAIATLQDRDPQTGLIQERQFALAADCGLVSHYPPGATYDSTLEESFVDRWAKTKTEWRLEREVDLIPIPGSVAIPDFRLVHPDGRSYLLEIVGYWRPEYLRKKFAQVQKADRPDLILAISERLNLEKAGVAFDRLPNKLIWFKDKLTPKAVLAAIDPP